jgi:hypothetical protein
VGHALIAYVLASGPPPDNLVVLQVPDERALCTLAHKLAKAGVYLEEFTEPDLDDETTALAVHPDGWRMLSELPLMK